MDDVVFEFRLPEFGILLLTLFLIYGITWLKNALEAGLGPPATAAAGADGGGEDPGDEVTEAGPDPSTPESPDSP